MCKKNITKVAICQLENHGLFSTGGCSVRQCRVLRRVRGGSVRLYSTSAAQEQGARLTTMRHRCEDFSQKLRQ